MIIIIALHFSKLEDLHFIGTFIDSIACYFMKFAKFDVGLRDSASDIGVR